MAKELKDWIDEFVEQGANPKDVTNWPEEAGGGTTVVANPTLVGDEPDLTGIQVGGQKYKTPQGGGGGETYTAGEGINISEDNVISAEKTIVLVNELPNEGEADKLYKLPNGDVYEWTETETQTDVTEISVGKRFILADTINNLDYNRMANECFKIGGQYSRAAQISKDLTIIVSGQYDYLEIRSNSSPNRYESYCGFYCSDYYSQNPHWVKREQNFKHYPFIEITQTLINSISSFGGSIEYITPLFKKEVTYSYGWSKISNYKLSESLELVDGALSIKNGFVNEGNPVFINENSLGMNDLEKICYLGTDGAFSGFKNCLIHASISRNNGFTEDFSGYLKPESISDDGLVARFCSDVNKSENGEFRAVVELHYGNGSHNRQGGYTVASVVRSIEYIMGILTLTQGDTITDQMFDSLVAKDTETGMNLCFKNCFLKLIIHDSLGGQIICYPSNIRSYSVSYKSGVIKSGDKKYYYEVEIYNNQHSWGYQINFIHEEKAIPSWCNGYILTSNYTQMKKARLNMDNLKNTLFNSSDYLSEPISSFIGTGTSYITIAILNNESSGAQRNSMITFICEKLENPEDCRIEVLLEREQLYSKNHTFDSENFTWLDVFEFLHNEADISDFNLCNAHFSSGTMILETPDPEEGLVLYDSVSFGFSNEIIFGNNDGNLYGLVLIKDVKGFFDFVIVEGGSSSSSSN